MLNASGNLIQVLWPVSDRAAFQGRDTGGSLSTTTKGPTTPINPDVPKAIRHIWVYT